MALLERDDWPGNARELEAVVKRAMVCRRVGWLTREDIVLRRLRRIRDKVAMCGIELTPVQEDALRLASSRGEVKRGDLLTSCAIFRETARTALLGLERARLVRRDGNGWAARYVLLT
jgi:DNA-binding NtrC family response regulator